MKLKEKPERNRKRERRLSFKSEEVQDDQSDQDIDQSSVEAN